jgi:formyl-CoA transferase/CoA:oxalate CoA-transferase
MSMVDPTVPPLAGIRVLDLSRLFAGPYCTMMLADLGADVVKVEAPTGDEARRFGPPFLAGEGMNFMALNRNKRGMVVDLKTPGGREVVTRLARRADVVVENFRPGVTERLGIDYATLSGDNPGLVYCSISGFGREGAYALRPALDIILQAMTGVMHRQGRGVRPELMAITVADTFAAALAVQGVLAALLARARNGGRGQLVEVTLFDALIAAQGYRMISRADRIELPAWDDVCPYQAFQGSDGMWFVVAVVSDANWRALCQAIGREELLQDPRFADNAARVQHRDSLVPELERVFACKPASEWLAALSDAGVPVGPVRTVEDLFDDPHVIDAGTIVEVEHPTAGRVKTMGSAVRLSRTPLQVKGAAPLLGQHTREVLAELGFSGDEVSQLLGAGAVREAS